MIRKIITIVLVSFFAVFLTTSAFAANPWDVKIFNDKKSGIEKVCSAMTINLCCVVTVMMNGDIKIRTEYFGDKNKKVIHKISMDAKNCLIENHIQTIRTVNNHGWLNWFSRSGGDPVFDMYCIGLAKKLPPDVRKKFKGAYGL